MILVTRQNGGTGKYMTATKSDGMRAAIVQGFFGLLAVTLVGILGWVLTIQYDVAQLQAIAAEIQRTRDSIEDISDKMGDLRTALVRIENTEQKIREIRATFVVQLERNEQLIRQSLDNVDNRVQQEISRLVARQTQIENYMQGTYYSGRPAFRSKQDSLQ